MAERKYTKKNMNKRILKKTEFAIPGVGRRNYFIN